MQRLLFRDMEIPVILHDISSMISVILHFVRHGMAAR